MGVVVDFFENVFEQAAAFLSNVYEAVVGGVNWIVDQVCSVMSNLYGWISDHLAVVILAVGVACCIFYPYISAYVSNITSILSKVWTWTTAFINNLKYSFKLFLEAIHFKTLLRVHEILYFVSSDYRYYCQKLMYEFSQFSASVGFDAQTVVLAIQNARTLVLDVSASMGFKYDMAEITWLKNLQEYARCIEFRGKLYADNPWHILTDIDDLLIRPAINVKAATSSAILGGIDGALDAIKRTVEDVSKVRTDLMKLINDLPAGMREDMQSLVKPIIVKFDNFLTYTFWPLHNFLNNSVNLINRQVSWDREDIKSIVERLKNPAHYMLEINHLPESERLQAEKYVSDIAFSPYNRGAAVNAVEYQTKLETLKSIAEALNRSKVNEQWYVSEIEKPVRPAFAPAIPRNTWFVGDF